MHLSVVLLCVFVKKLLDFVDGVAGKSKFREKNRNKTILGRRRARARALLRFLISFYIIRGFYWNCGEIGQRQKERQIRNLFISPEHAYQAAELR